MHYPILAKTGVAAGGAGHPQIPEIRDPSLYAPRDFDASPYFTVVKPAIENGFDYKALPWADAPEPLAQGETEVLTGNGDENRLAPAGARQPAQLAA